MRIQGDRIEEMLGSYAPGKTNEKKFPLEEAPSGLLFRGKYDVRSKFTDDDGHSFLDFNWTIEVSLLYYFSNRLTCWKDQEELGLTTFVEFVFSICIKYC